MSENEKSEAQLAAEKAAAAAKKKEEKDAAKAALVAFEDRMRGTIY